MYCLGGQEAQPSLFLVLLRRAVPGATLSAYAQEPRDMSWNSVNGCFEIVEKLLLLGACLWSIDITMYTPISVH